MTDEEDFSVNLASIEIPFFILIVNYSMNRAPVCSHNVYLMLQCH